METRISGKSRTRLRASVLSFFFCQGLCFASWASRIPDIKLSLGLNEAALGSILLALPTGQLTCMPFSGRLVTRFGSRRIMKIAIPAYALALVLIGQVGQVWQLPVALYLLGISGNLVNISVNTQAVGVEAVYNRPIMASFHGAWSLAGFTGAAVGALMRVLRLHPGQHFMIVAAIVILNVLISSRFLLSLKSAAGEKRPLFKIPPAALLQLGVIGFCSLAAEGAMFDWSGVYFQEVVKAPRAWITLGYAAFMCAMATGRFVGDRLAHRLGKKRMLEVSGVLIFSGLGISVLFPYIVPATAGFIITGFGVSSVIPSLYSMAGKSGLTAPGIAIASVSGIAFFGFLMGPPVIGYVAQALSLRFSYAFIAVLGLCISFLTAKASLIHQKAV
jgi:MFS family permease